MKRTGWIAATLAVPLVISTLYVSATAPGQSRTPPGSITGRVIVPLMNSQETFEVRLVQNVEQPIQTQVVDNLGRFRFTGLFRGTYYLLVTVHGFQDVRQRVDVGSVDVLVNIILEFEEERIVKPPTDFSGEEADVIDVSDLKGSHSAQVVETLKTAEEDFQNGDYLRALTPLEALVTESPDLYSGHRLLGMVYQRLGRFRDAESAYRTAADLRQTSAAPWINLGSLYLQEAEANASKGSAVVRGILNESLGSLNTAVRLNPNAAFAYYLLGVTYYRASFYEEAEGHLKRSIGLASDLLDARLALANVYIRIQEWSNAIAQLDAYLAGNPKAEMRKQAEDTRAKIVARSQARVR